jgi:Zn-dependent protease
MASIVRPPALAAYCAKCGSHVAPALLACPGCGVLVHLTMLNEIAARAEGAETAGDLTAALAHWREALELLPPGAPQYAPIHERIAGLSERVTNREPNASAVPAPAAGVRHAWKNGGVAAALVAVVLKFKTLLLIVLTKGKLLLLGFTKLPTLLSMAAYGGYYWTRWGWPLALGFLLALYVHEMGHVIVLRRYGVKVGAPIFIPGFGAFVMLKQVLNNPRENARTGLAGPLYGLAATLLAYGAYLATGRTTLGAIAALSGVINAANLLPVWVLDGGRGFATLTRRERWIAAGGVAAIAVLFHAPLLLMLACVCGAVALIGRPSERSDPEMLGLYLLLVAAHSGVAILAHSAVAAVGL